MKKRKLKKWVVWCLVAIDTVALLVASSECEDMTMFVVSHIIACAVFAICSYILLKNSKEE